LIDHDKLAASYPYQIGREPFAEITLLKDCPSVAAFEASDHGHIRCEHASIIT
jgi:hypothetical protein